jgi:hypothetical protein
MCTFGSNQNSKRGHYISVTSGILNSLTSNYHVCAYWWFHPPSVFYLPLSPPLRSSYPDYHTHASGFPKPSLPYLSSACRPTKKDTPQQDLIGGGIALNYGELVRQTVQSWRPDYLSQDPSIHSIEDAQRSY